MRCCQPKDPLQLEIVVLVGKNEGIFKIICTWVAIGQKGANWEENLRDRQSWTPIVFEDIQANDALTVDVAVVDAGTKCHFWRLEWVLRGKVDI